MTPLPPYAVVRFEGENRQRARDVLIAFDNPQAADLFAVENGYGDYLVAPVSAMAVPAPPHTDRPRLQIYANYLRAPLGGWLAVVVGAGEQAVTVEGRTPAEVFEAVAHTVAAIADRRATPCATVHSLDGDTAAFARFAREYRLGERA